MADDTMENTLQRNEDPPSYESTIHPPVSNASAIQTKDARKSPKLMATPSPGAHPDRPHESVTPFRHHPPYPYHHFHPIANKYPLGNKGDYHQGNHTFPPYHYPPLPIITPGYIIGSPIGVVNRVIQPLVAK